MIMVLARKRKKRNQDIFDKEDDINYIANKNNSGAQVSRNVGILASKRRIYCMFR